MKQVERQLAGARDARDAARRMFDARLAHVRADLEARGIGGRIADRIGEDARDGFDQALDVAKESKGVIAGTIAALALWFLRHPIMAWVEGLLGTPRLIEAKQLMDADAPDKETSSE